MPRRARAGSEMLQSARLRPGFVAPCGWQGFILHGASRSGTEITEGGVPILVITFRSGARPPPGGAAHLYCQRDDQLGRLSRQQDTIIGRTTGCCSGLRELTALMRW